MTESNNTMKSHSTTCYVATMLTALTALALLTACGSETTAPTELGYLRPRDWHTITDMKDTIRTVTGGCATYTDAEGIGSCAEGDQQTYLFTIDPADLDPETTQPRAGTITMTARAQAEERNVAAAVLIGPRWQIACYGTHALSNCSVLRGAFNMKTMDVYNLEQADNADDFRTDVTVRIRD
jgi:hypothetical protein|nr:hypothetical protein [uncultured Corynebacterium sp.]